MTAQPDSPADGEDEAVTRLLDRINVGDENAWEDLLRLVGATLKRIASRELNRESPGHTLQPTALVNEAYLRLSGSRPEWKGRSHFFALAGRAMRQILVDHQRIRNAAKRGGNALRQPISGVGLVDDQPLLAEERADGLEVLHCALERMAREEKYARKVQVVDLLFFVGFTVDQTATALNASRATVLRDWQFAKAWLYREMRREGL